MSDPEQARMPMVVAKKGIPLFAAWRSFCPRRRGVRVRHVAGGQEAVQGMAFAARRKWQNYMAVLEDRLATIGKFRTIAIEANLGTWALHELPYFAEQYSHDADTFPNAVRLYRSCLVLPLHLGLLDNQVAHIATTPKTVIENV